MAFLTAVGAAVDHAVLPSGALARGVRRSGERDAADFSMPWGRHLRWERHYGILDYFWDAPVRQRLWRAVEHASFWRTSFRRQQLIIRGLRL